VGRVVTLVSLTAIGQIAVAVTIAREAIGSALSPRTISAAMVIFAGVRTTAAMCRGGIQVRFAAVNYFAVTIVKA